MKGLGIGLLLVLLGGGVTGCANMTPRRQRALRGGSPGVGAAIGGAAGGVTGALIK
jgi:hypothetical protein